MRKPRILLVAEASWLRTGYGVMSGEILKRLHTTGKYDLAELAIFGHHADPASRGIPWKVYGNLPDPGNEEQNNQYNSDTMNKFGRWRFDQVCIDFMPDHVFSYTDPFMIGFAGDSPFRDLYKWHYQPTVDAFPQSDEWLSLYTQADSILTYSKWAYDQLAQQCKNTINLVGVASPAADSNIFKPIPDKKGLREHYGLESDIFIVGAVMRSQLRKRYSELFETFAAFLKKAPKEIAEKTYLYCHTTYPDMGWHFPTLLKDFNLSSRVIFTYKCGNCGKVIPSFFQEGRAVCPKCNQGSLVTPSARMSVETIELAQIFNLFDVMVQPSLAEGCGIPLLESASCAVPSMCTDYSAMCDFKDTIAATPLKVHEFYREPQTGRFFGLFDKVDLCDKLINYFKQPELLRKKKSVEVHKKYHENYSWDKCVNKWMSVFDSYEIDEGSGKTWLSAPRIHQPPTEVPGNLPATELVNWAFSNVMGRPEMAHDYLALRIIRDLNQGFTLSGDGNIQGFGPKEAVDFLYAKRNEWNRAEEARINILRSKGLIK